MRNLRRARTASVRPFELHTHREIVACFAALVHVCPHGRAALFANRRNCARAVSRHHDMRGHAQASPLLRNTDALSFPAGIGEQSVDPRRAEFPGGRLMPCTTIRSPATPAGLASWFRRRDAVSPALTASLGGRPCNPRPWGYLIRALAMLQFSDILISAS